MLKSYDELRRIDVSKYTEERDGIQYLNWAKCVDLLHENGAETVYFEPVPNPLTGSTLYMTNKEFLDKNKVANQCYETEIKVFVDNQVWTMRGPVTNGSNPVKDNSMSQQRLWNCQCRLFVKCIAIHTGLGFDLWLKEEHKIGKTESKFEDLFSHNILTIKERIEQLITEKLDSGLTLEEIAEKTKMGTGDDIRDLLKSLIRAYNFEGYLRKL